MIYEKTFEKIEKTFGFKLHDWQKDYISMKIDYIPVGGRCCGKTFAFILRQLLNYEEKIKFGDKKQFYECFVCDRNEPIMYKDWFINETYKIAEILETNGIDNIFYF